MAMDRRTFFKSTAGAAVAVAAMTTIDMRAWAQVVEEAPVELKGSLCNVCSSHCGMYIHVKNGRPWKVTGHPDHSRSRGKLCPRAHGGLYWIYDPARAKTPLKRVGEQEFEQISWEQATDEIAERLKRVLDQHGPQAVFYGHNPRRSGVVYGNRFMHALGVNTIQTHNAACNTARVLGLAHTFGSSYNADWANSDYLLFIGRNMGEGIRTSTALAFGEAIARGATVVCVDPRLNESAAIAEWVPIRPGTDMALLLAIANVLVTEDLYDKEFINTHTIGFHRFERVLPQYTPEWAEELTTIPADRIRSIARGLAAAAPAAAVDTGWKGAFGAAYANSTDTARAVAYVNALLGNLNKRGGIRISRGASLASLPFQAPETPTGPRGDGVGTDYPLATGHGLPHLSMEKAQKGLVKAGIIRHHNPLRTIPDYDHMLAGYRSLDLLVVIETHMTETALEADYILPEPSFAEREEVIEATGPSICMRTKAIEKVHPETKSFDEIITLLANKMGVGRYFDFTLDELNEALLSGQPFSLADLREAGSIEVSVDQPEGVPELNTPSGKFEFYSQRFADEGFNGVAEWYPPETGLQLRENEFRVVHGKQAYHSHCATANIPMLAQVTKDYDTNRVWLNAERAANLGISDGDYVRFTAPDGRSGEARVKVTERIHPDMAFAPGAYGNRTPYFELSEKLGGFNPHDITAYRSEPIVGHTMMSELIVEVKRV